MADEIKMGIYRHYKGPKYQVFGLASDANADKLWEIVFEGPLPKRTQLLQKRIVVVYIGLEYDGAVPGPRMTVRTLEDFTAWVCGDDTHEIYGQVATTGSCMVRRFTYLGSEFTEEMREEWLNTE